MLNRSANIIIIRKIIISQDVVFYEKNNWKQPILLIRKQRTILLCSWKKRDTEREERVFESEEEIEISSENTNEDDVFEEEPDIVKSKTKIQRAQK